MDKIWSHGNTFGFCLSFRGVSVSVRVQWAVRDACWTFDWFVKVILTLSGILWWLVFPSEVWHTLLWISLQKTRLLVCLHSFWWVNYRQETIILKRNFQSTTWTSLRDEDCMFQTTVLWTLTGEKRQLGRSSPGQRSSRCPSLTFTASRMKYRSCREVSVKSGHVLFQSEKINIGCENLRIYHQTDNDRFCN